MKFFIRTIVGCILLSIIATHSPAYADGKSHDNHEIKEKVILGWLEFMWLKPWQIKTKAKLDTGAKTSSIHAKNIEHFDKDGQPWVRFQFGSSTKLSNNKYKPGKSKKVVTIEAPLYRKVIIKQHKRSNVERPVVMLPFIMGGVEYTAQFTLTDRSKFLYPVLLRRRFLKDIAIIDPDNTYLRTSNEAYTRLDIDGKELSTTAADNETDTQNTPAKEDKDSQTDQSEHRKT